MSPAQLAEVWMKALEADPEHRYGTVFDLRQRAILLRHLEDYARRQVRLEFALESARATLRSVVRPDGRYRPIFVLITDTLRERAKWR